MNNQKTYLALGDSYTIGEAVLPEERWVHQLVDKLQLNGVDVSYPEIIATTGWTTGELLAALKKNPPKQQQYDWVSLLIGVNNQYRKQPLEQFSVEFEQLLNIALKYAINKDNVIVLSIPNWGVTPFAADREVEAIRQEIIQFNQIAEQVTQSYAVKWIDIMPISELAAQDLAYVAEDNLHFSGKMYALWVEKILQSYSFKR
jgi:lysophospholipase L1-like esterase